MNVPSSAWIAVIGAVGTALAIDLLVVHRRARPVSLREAAFACAAWVAAGVTFGGVVWAIWGSGPAGQYFSGYLIEKSLSVDNIFVFALLLGSFAVPAAHQHRVLFWGVVGALILRGGFIAAGAALLENLHWAMYGFGALLVVSAAKFARRRPAGRPDRKLVVRLLGRIIPVDQRYGGGRFLYRRAGRLTATPLLAVLLAIETTDVVFAIDSIPAIFAITDEPFLVFTSNAFAILGMRALYFLLAGAIDRFVHLKAGLAAILAFVGMKMLLADLVHIPVWASLTVIVAVLTAAMLASRRPPDLRVSTPPEEPKVTEAGAHAFARVTVDR